jgi:hypothetical protein
MMLRADSLKKRANEAATEAAYAALAAAMELEEANNEIALAGQPSMIMSPISEREEDDHDYMVGYHRQGSKLKNQQQKKETIMIKSEIVDQKKPRTNVQKDNNNDNKVRMNHHDDADDDNVIMVENTMAGDTVVKLTVKKRDPTMSKPKPERIKSKVSKVLSNEKVIDITTAKGEEEDQHVKTASMVVSWSKMSMEKSSVVPTMHPNKMTQAKPISRSFDNAVVIDDANHWKVGTIATTETASTIPDVVPSLLDNETAAVCNSKTTCKKNDYTSIVAPPRRSRRNNNESCAEEWKMKDDPPSLASTCNSCYHQSPSTYHACYAFFDAQRAAMNDVEEGKGTTNGGMVPAADVVDSNYCCNGQDESKKRSGNMVGNNNNNIRSMMDEWPGGDISLVQDWVKENDDRCAHVQHPFYKKNKIGLLVGIVILLLVVIGATAGITFCFGPDNLCQQSRDDDDDNNNNDNNSTEITDMNATSSPTSTGDIPFGPNNTAASTSAAPVPPSDSEDSENNDNGEESNPDGLGSNNNNDKNNSTSQSFENNIQDINKPINSTHFHSQKRKK